MPSKVFPLLKVRIPLLAGAFYPADISEQFWATLRAAHICHKQVPADDVRESYVFVARHG